MKRVVAYEVGGRHYKSRKDAQRAEAEEAVRQLVYGWVEDQDGGRVEALLAALRRDGWKTVNVLSDWLRRGGNEDADEGSR